MKQLIFSFLLFSVLGTAQIVRKGGSGATCGNPNCTVTGTLSVGGAVSAQKGVLTESVIATNAKYLNDINVTNDATNYHFTHAGKQYTCYMDTAAPSHLWFAVRTLSTDAVARYDTGIQGMSFDENDDHLACSFGFDKGGYIWLSYNMHGSHFFTKKSTNPEDASAFGGLVTFSPLTSGCPDDQFTYPTYIQNPAIAEASRELYFMIRCGISGSGNQFFLHYNYATTTWEAATGTSTNGLLVSGTTDSPDTSPYFNGTPQFDSSGNLWFNWSSREGATTDNSNLYLIRWTGTVFQTLTGSAVTVPITRSNLTACVTIGYNNQLWNTHRFSVDSTGVVHIPYQKSDGTNLQWYVAETSNGTTCTVHQISSFTNTPNATANQYLELAAISLLGKTHVLVPDVLSNTPGIAVFTSSDHFATYQKYYISSRVNPNWVAYPDPVQLLSGTVSMIYEDTNGGGAASTTSYLYLGAGNTSLGRLSRVDWTPTVDAAYPMGTPQDDYFRNLLQANWLSAILGINSLGPYVGTTGTFSGPVSGVGVTDNGSSLAKIDSVNQYTNIAQPAANWVQSANAQTGANGSVTASFGTLPVAGHYILVGVATGGTSTGVTDNQGHTYTLMAGPANGSGNRSYIYCTRVNTSSGTFTLTATGSSYVTLLPEEYVGLLSCGTNGTSLNSSSGTVLTAGNIVTTNANVLIFAVGASACGPGTGTSWTAAGGYTLRSKKENTVVYECGTNVEKFVTSTGTYNAGATLNSGSDNWAMAAAAFPVVQATPPSGKSYPYADSTTKQWQIVSDAGVVGRTVTVLSGTSSLDFPSTANGACSDLTFTLTGAATGDYVIPMRPAALPAGTQADLFVSATNTITARYCNFSGGASDPSAMTYGAMIIR